MKCVLIDEVCREDKDDEWTKGSNLCENEIVKAWINNDVQHIKYYASMGLIIEVQINNLLR